MAEAQGVWGLEVALVRRDQLGSKDRSSDSAQCTSWPVPAAVPRCDVMRMDVAWAGAGVIPETLHRAGPQDGEPV